ncbi:hypothetical protein HMI01_24730 [Halolactibacillus miurensis]|uniref:Iron-sulfur cluster assembly protein n=1 Tax=Halolactibacillus miurensis TaxID=306541 RepID=A0A1I6RDF9_9BACI|nr:MULTISPECIES: iron-sulfur cluster assembly accessory protein [Halolactibacillus]GEM05485.1 hypothetical protein HMI01_24730 [Halolactibacillus miurensis]SFS62759.1 iron-sulfur cluster assembly protein [Halolactibacillus miurensis]
MLLITDRAKRQFEEMLQRERDNQTRVRFGVKDGLCNGLSYTLGFDTRTTDNDHIETINSIPFIIKKSDVALLRGATIDFEQDMMGGGFSIYNPQAEKECCCSSKEEEEVY